ncbi:MAG: hypothetical protein JOZ39_12150 [Chloroflexi bacterium]|nr:hypothetical protein [Chloroflexota bacterium]
MSRYLVDKFLYTLHHDGEAKVGYAADPRGYVERWESEVGPRLLPWESLSEHRFSEAEREALQARDVGALYSMGAHPFMLLGVLGAAWRSEYPDAQSWSRYYVEQIEGHGRPSFGM